jgi:hypothetical protein
MVQQVSRRRHGGSPGEPVGNRLTDDWPVYVAFLPAVLASAAIGIAAALALGTASSWHQSLSEPAGVKHTPGADDYVAGLARLGIAKIPRYEPSSLVHSRSRGGPLPVSHLARGCVVLG